MCDTYNLDILIKRLIDSLKKNNIDALYFSNRKEAVDQILNLIPEGSSVAYGGSLTIDELGLKEIFKKGNYNFIDRGKANIRADEMFALRRESLLADFFVCSTNALTLDGELVNIDGVGNRVAALAFGPRKVIVVTGINKIVENLDKALERIRNKVAPIHARRRGRKVPCAYSGFCSDCRSPERICNIISIIKYQRERGRLLVIIIGEALGL